MTPHQGQKPEPPVPKRTQTPRFETCTYAILYPSLISVTAIGCHSVSIIGSMFCRVIGPGNNNHSYDWLDLHLVSVSSPLMAAPYIVYTTLFLAWRIPRPRFCYGNS